MTKQEDYTGVNFTGHSKGGNVYIVGKVFDGKLESTVFIVQYVLKDSGTDEALARVKTWERVLSAIH